MTAKRWAAVVAAWAVAVGAVGVVGTSGKEFAAGRIVLGGRAGQPGPGGTVNLPWMVQDGKGQTWRIYQNGYFQNQGPTPNGGNTSTFSQSGVLMVNGQNPQSNNNAGRVDEKTGELVLENLQGNGVVVTRRIFVDKENGLLRYIDVFKNTQGADQNLNVVLSTNLNYGTNTAQNVTDKKNNTIGWAAQTGSMACLFEMFAGKGSKVTPQIVAQPGNSQSQATYQLAVPAGKEVAIMHLHGMVPTQDAGVQFMTGLKESKLLKSIPAPLRKLIVNFPGGQSFIGDFEVLRGDLLDVVELKGGDQLKGTLKDDKYELTTFYGPVSLPVDRVIGVINVGQFRPRQLIVTVDGQVFGGTMKKQTIDLQLSSGQVTQVPLGQVNRVGYRKRPGEPEEWTFEKPLVLMRSGERVGVKLPAGTLEVATRYGKLAVKPEQVAAVLLQTEEGGIHQVFLTDGSKFSGVVAVDQFDMALEDGGGDVHFPASSVARIQFTPKVTEVEDATPTLRLANDDLLVGTVGGTLKVDTAFDTITINAAEVRSLAPIRENATDVQVVLFDGTSLSGQLQELDLPVTLAGGLQLKVPVALLQEYAQPQPQPSKEMVDRIKKVIEDLNSADWKQRDRAQAALTSMGPVAISVLKQLRDGQPPEAQKRIKEILDELEKQRDKKSATGGGGIQPGAAAPLDVEQRQFPLLNVRVGD